MAEVVFGIGTSHTPMLSMSPQRWPELGEQFDRAMPELDFDARAAHAPDWLPAELNSNVWKDKYEAAQRALDQLRVTMGRVAPDVVLIVGNDQEEMFLEYTPMFALMKADVARDMPADMSSLPKPLREAWWAYHGDKPVEYPLVSSLDDHLIKALADGGFDIAVCTDQTEGRSIGHAFTFVERRIMPDFSTPIVPIMINTYYPPNQASPARCIELGQAIAQAIKTWDNPARIAVAASGGLSHFAVEADLDRKILRHLEHEEFDQLAAIPREVLKLGTSEALNWITAARILAEFGRRMHLINYIPAYRSMAASGVGIAFATWT